MNTATQLYASIGAVVQHSVLPYKSLCAYELYAEVLLYTAVTHLLYQQVNNSTLCAAFLLSHQLLLLVLCKLCRVLRHSYA
jgi:hypothetical protein